MRNLKKQSNWNLLLTKPQFYSVIRFSILIVITAASLMLVTSINTLSSWKKQQTHINRLSNTLSKISDFSTRVLVDYYTQSDSKEWDTLTEKYASDYEQLANTLKSGSLSGDYSYLNNLININNLITIKFDEITERFKGLNNIKDDYLSLSPIIEQRYNILRKKVTLKDNLFNKYMILKYLENNLYSVINIINSAYLINLEDLKIKIDSKQTLANTLMYTSISLYLLSVILLVLGNISRQLIEAKEAEENSRERSEELEELVRSRTLALEEQNKKLKETQKLLVEQEKLASMGTVVSGVAHEVNTPLGVCVTATSYLMEKINPENDSPPDKKALTEIAEIILSNLNRASKIINGFRRLSMDSSEEKAVAFDLYDLLLHDMYPSLKHTLLKNRHTLELTGIKKCSIVSYPTAISQIVTNLVINASIHGYGADNPGKIEINLDKNDSHVFLSVIDNGSGINKETGNRIFEPFYTTKRGQGSTGLGLMIVYNLVKGKLNGEISYKSEEGKGTEFIVKFPVSAKTG